MSKPTLHYFNVRARGELVRLIFAAAGVEYDDHRIEFAEWPELKAHAPLGQLPYLQVGDVRVPQSIAIARYAARETNLAGENNLQQVNKKKSKQFCIKINK
jgi:glutathione S-transferase